MVNGFVEGEQPSVFDLVFKPATPQEGAGTPRVSTLGESFQSVFEAMFSAGRQQAVNVLTQTEAGQEIQRTALQQKLQGLFGSPIIIIGIIVALVFFGSRLAR